MKTLQSNWQVKKLGEIAPSIQYGYTESSTLEKVGPRFLRITDIQNGKVDWNAVPYCKCDDFDKYRLKSGDILFARTGATTGKSFLISECPESVFASYLIRVQLSQEVYPGYIYQFFQTPSYWSHITQFTTGSTQGGFNASKLAEISIPLPPLPIQKQIAAILEKADAAREKRRQANQLTEQFLQSAFLEMFGDPVTNPKGWERKRLGDVITKITNGYVGPTRDIYQEAGIPYILSKHIKGNRILFDKKTFISAAFNQKNKKSILRQGDVLLVQTGDIGQAAVVPIDHVGHNCHALIVMSPVSDVVNGTYLSHYLTSDAGIKQTERIETGATLRHLNCHDVKELQIPVPLISEQQKFAALVEKVEGLRGKQSKSEKELENLFQSLMQRAFRGELVN